MSDLTTKRAIVSLAVLGAGIALAVYFSVEELVVRLGAGGSTLAPLLAAVAAAAIGFAYGEVVRTLAE